MIRTSLIAVPKRGRVLAAKSLVFAVVTFVVGEATSFTAFFVGQALISGHAPHAALGDTGVARAVVGAGLALTALAVLSVAVGALLRHPAAGVGPATELVPLRSLPAIGSRAGWRPGDVLPAAGVRLRLPRPWLPGEGAGGVLADPGQSVAEGGSGGRTPGSGCVRRRNHACTLRE